MGIGAEDGLPQSVFDHVTQHEFGDCLVHLYRDPDADRLADSNHLNGVTGGIDQIRLEYAGLATTRSRRDLAIRRALLAYGAGTALGQHAVVVIHHHFRLALHFQATRIEQDRAVANALHSATVVRNDQQCGSLPAIRSNPVEALVLKIAVAHGEGLVDDQDVRAPCRGHTECEPDLHSAGVNPYRLIDVFANLGERLDLGHQPVEILHGVAKQLAGHDGVLSTGEIRMEPHSKFEQRRNPPSHG